MNVEEFVIRSILIIVSLIMVFMIALGVYIGGWAVGFWEASCKIESKQPKCAAQGWNYKNQHIYIERESNE